MLVKQIILFFDFFCKEASQTEFTSVSKIPIILSRSDFVLSYFRLQQFHFLNFQLTSITAKSTGRKLMMKLIKVSNENSKTLDSPKSFTKLIFRESKLINQITKTNLDLR